MSLKIAGIVIALALVATVVAINFNRSSPKALPVVAVMAGDTQIIEVLAKYGYHPTEITAKAGVPTVLKLKTDDTLDCSRAFTLPELGIRKDLDITGEVSFDIPAQQAGTTLRGVCSMGMDSFVIRFD